MSELAGGETVYRRPRMGDHLSVAVWVSPGLPEYVAEARRWAAAVAAAWEARGADMGLAVSELVTNALRYTRSGQPGGTVTVLIAGGWDAVTVHVHDQGADSGQVPWRRRATAEADGGRGLPIVAALSAEWGTIPVAWCPVRESGDPAVDVAGCCTWCRLQTRPYEQDKEDKSYA